MPDQPDQYDQAPEGPRVHQTAASALPTLDDFRRRIDTFWAHPRTADLKRTIGRGVDDTERVLSPSDVSPARLRVTLAARPDQADFRLQKSLTYRNGQLVSISGDDRPLAPDDRILIVTTTTTIMDAESMVVEAELLMFERET